MGTTETNTDDIESCIKVKDLETVIQLMKKLYSIHPANSKMADTLQDLEMFLHPYRNKDATEFIELLKVSLGSKKKIEAKKKSDKLKNISYEEFVKASRQDFSKEDLMHLAHRFFKISSSRMKRLGKKDILDLIDDSIENRDTLDAIARRASEK